MATQTPLQRVKEEYGSKDKLVDALMSLVTRKGESKDQLKTRLKTASNDKLLRLHRTHTTIKEQFGDKEKLVDALLAAKNRTKDNDYREKLLSYSPGRLLDMHRSTQRRAN